ncbi:accessory gene regulator ArgB-like protein [Romboutsia timonensis]|jgi:accessory gene regulator B|uniref:accessory gene regulator ArgB-like protein n=1 Tax=Romboutsia timonensis TaxID=1776391 RepID=UPI0008D8ECF6|nr:accessory gene regulator B family protein [Romboutsia timonensis]
MGGIEKIALNLSTRLGNKLDKGEEEKAILNYGLFIIMHTFIGIIITLLVGLITGMLIEILLITITSALFKRYTGGVHASTPEICLIIGVILSLILSILCRFIVINIDINKIVFAGMIIIAFSYYMIYYNCPVSSKNKPLKNEKTRKKLKKKAFILLNIYTILLIMLYIIYYILKISIVKSIITSFILGIFFQMSSLTNIGSKTINLLDKVFAFLNK